MSYCKKHVKKIKVEDDNDANPNNHERAVQCHNFWNEAPEDLLMEIFIRHPDCRSAARTSTVCRRWHALIHRNRRFIQRFESHHDRKIIPWTIMFRKTDYFVHYSPQPKHFRNICQLSSEGWMFLHGKSPADCSDLLPSPMLIKASCNDLLLVSPDLSYIDNLFICNPVTKQFVQLPAAPRPEGPIFYKSIGRIGYALVPMPPSAATSHSQFKVVKVLQPFFYSNYDKVQVFVFCSESRKWEIRHFPCHPATIRWRDVRCSNIIRCNEILFWVGSSEQSERIVYLDLSKEKCWAIEIPSGCEVFTYKIGILHVSGGVDELRLIQVIPMDNEIDHLNVWRLNNNHNNDNDEDDWNWILVHDKKLKRPKELSEALLPDSGSFVHPINGNLVFIACGRSAFEYNLIDETYKKMAELLEIAHWLNFTPFLVDLSSASSNLADTYI